MSPCRAGLLLFVASLALLTARVVNSADPKPDEVKGVKERTVAEFSLPDPRTGTKVSWSDFKDKKAVVVLFLGTECPINNAFAPYLAELYKEFAPEGVAFLGINANQQDTPEIIAEHAQKHGIPFPVLKDDKNRVADDFGARRTPEAFILSPARKVLYQGRIDDQFGIGYSRPGKPTRRDLAEALNEVLTGKPVSVPTTAVAGCLIARETRAKDEGPITYAKQVSRILQQNCQGCHRPGQIGPFSLMTYKSAVAWADNIKEVVSEGRMPPWYADPRYGHFSNDRSLSKEDRETLLKWIDQGLARGDDKDLPPPRTFPEGWTIGKPDVVITMPKPFDVPAETPQGGVPYQYFSINTDFTEDKWVERAEAKPGATAVVHHIVVFIVPPGERFNPDGPKNVLTGTAPGDMPLVLQPGQAKKIPAKARLVFQMHYTPNGKAQQDQSSIGLIFAKEPPKHWVLTRAVSNRDFILRRQSIPAGADNHAIEAEWTVPDDAHIVSFMPHMHLRGKDFLYTLITPDGKEQTLLSVPRYSFGWQSIYRCAEPIAAPKGTKVRCVAHFDNSAKNPNNPDPTKPVFWGDQTWEEMMIGWTDYYFDNKQP
jgi:peroxiredoxin/mono/diheme cytochrome c family protein